MLETRHLVKITSGSGSDTWSTTSYAWNQAQTDATLSQREFNVLGTNHDIPNREQCVNCHKGSEDFILGFSAIQLSEAQAQFAAGHRDRRTQGQAPSR